MRKILLWVAFILLLYALFNSMYGPAIALALIFYLLVIL